jgi:phosphonoacetaldehyde hydrolase
VWPAWSAIKVDDTTVGVAEGLNTGAWAVGFAATGNCFGLSLADAKALAPEHFARRCARAYDVLYGAGAHYVVDSVADLMPQVALIEGRLARGERP